MAFLKAAFFAAVIIIGLSVAIPVIFFMLPLVIYGGAFAILTYLIYLIIRQDELENKKDPE